MVACVDRSNGEQPVAITIVGFEPSADLSTRRKTLGR